MNNPTPPLTGNSTSNNNPVSTKNCFTCYFLSCECIDPKGCQANAQPNINKPTDQLNLFDIGHGDIL
ncbi:MAG: hypothetical protein IM618_11410 [Cytophagales bacterium]|nr:hypothetical protein [Cytophagales bacterium]